MLIGGFQKSSLIDYKGRIAAVVFLQGCNFLCPYCHNPELVFPKVFGLFREDEIISFLKTRINKLDGVVISGGEPTLHKKLPEFIEKIKELDFEIKLDTNGTNPDMIEQLVHENLIDYIAMDIKTSFDDYEKVVKKEVDINKIKKSFDFIINSNVDYEFRTTITSGLIAYDNFVKINDEFKKYGKIKRYYLQKFQPSKHVDPSFSDKKTFDDTEFDKLKELFKDSVEFIEVR